MSTETAGALFPGDEYRVEAVPPERISPDRRRTARQAEAVARGAHPLALVFGPMAFRRHPMTKGHAYSADDAKGARWTCGSCKWRQTVHYHNRAYPKCVHPGGYSGEDVVTLPPLWHSHSAATDVRAWWPACTDYDAGDAGLSADASRQWPEGTEETS